MSFSNYDPSRVVLSFRDIQINGGFQDGTFISAERNEDAFSMSVGSTGDVTRVRSRNTTGTVTLTMQAAASANDLLSAVAVEDELLGTGYGPLMIKDLNGNTLLDAPIAWIKKMPTTEFAQEASGREWMFDCAEFGMFVGGATF